MEANTFKVRKINLKSARLLSDLIQDTGLTYSKMTDLKLCVNCDFIYLGWENCPCCTSKHSYHVIYWEPEAWLTSDIDNGLRQILISHLI